MSRNYYKCFLAAVCLTSALLLAGGNPTAVPAAPAAAPYEREGYFNGTAYMRIHAPLSLRHHIGLSFRTCHGGELFTQRTNGNTVKLEVRNEGLLLTVALDSRMLETRIRADLLDNTWHTVNIVHRLGNLTLSAAGLQQVIANSTYNTEILTTELSSENSVLIVGNSFHGCILHGPGIIFNDSENSAHSVQWGQCPLNTNSCTKMDHCFNAPCFRGTCISRPDRYECRCTARYSGKNCDKDNGPICDRSPCLNSGICSEDTLGNYVCTCGPGHTGQHCETEMSSHLCENNPCQHDGSCRVSAIAGRYECTCQPGYAGDNCEVNVNECQSNPCQHGGACADGVNNYTCQCGRTGYSGANCEININECEHNPCLNQGRCFDTYGGYTCECVAGYGGSNCELNLDECSSTPCLNNGICTDQIGSYKCTCHLGFTGHNCEQNVDDCHGITCPPHAECLDGINSHKCVCKPGYLGVPPDCTEASSCQSLPCLNGGMCNKLDGVFNCTCLQGFAGTHCELELRNAALVDWCSSCRNGGSCGADNECECPQGFTGPTCEVAVTCATYPCRHGQCNDYLGGYYCTCEPGWTGPGCDADVNGCLTEPCRNAGSCVSSGNTHLCECVPGFTGKMCQTNLDECESSPCLNGGSCMDMVNGFSCNCTAEYMGERCEREMDVCSLLPCHHNGTCVGKRGRREYHCDCAAGYDGQHCETNVNECLSNPCPPERLCVDGVNTYECRCANGLAGDNCTAPVGDRCLGNPCLNNATCREAGGSHYCDCVPGFRGENCEMDVDECAESPRLCNNGICQNRAGGYDCFCRPGFSGDHCALDFDECLSHPCLHQATCVNKINSFACICPPGYTGRECGTEINECESNPCSAGATCVDQVAAYSCECPPGLAGRRCEINIDECESAPCHNGGRCMDEINAYVCDCSDTGFSGLHCQHNIDDCADAVCVNNGTCVDGINRYDCQCFAGYTGKNCEIDINECESSPCQNGGTCLQYSNRSLYIVPDKDHDVVSLPGAVPLPFQQEFSYSAASGFQCVCVAGVTGDNCEVNINECESNPCVSGTCIDKIGGFTCDCGEGFEGPLCEVDIDECLQQPCVNGTCTDKRADYVCDCQQGYGGKNCSVQLTGCDDGRCLNNGTCIPYLRDETEHMFNCSCFNGFHGPVCGTITTMSLNGHSYLMTNTSREEGYDIQFRFRTTLPSGVIALGAGHTYYILQLVDGRLNLHSSLLNKWDGVFIGSSLNNSKWHKVFVAINTSHVVLAANEEQTIYPINWNQDANVTHTSFSSTYLGGSPNLAILPHSQSPFIGCMQDVVVNNNWILPQDSTQSGVTAVGIEIGCQRSEQCNPNPCHNSGVCMDQWWNFACACERPFLGHTCQYTLTAATFGHESTAHSSVTVRVDEGARKALQSIVDISMFVRTREERGFIFYMGAADSLLPNATFIAAQLEGGELLVRIQFNGTHEPYTVGGLKLSDGRNYLIQVVRNVTLIQVKINGTEYFRKTISAGGPLDVQVLYLGGFPPSSRHARDVAGGSAALSGASLATAPNLKGIIQDVQITNGKQRMVVEFFPLQVEGLSIPKRLGDVSFDLDAVLEGVVSDDACRDEPCLHNGTCLVTWNDFLCECPRGYKGKTCADIEFCQLQNCPSGSACRNLDHGYECVANMTFDGANTTALEYALSVAQYETAAQPLDTVDITYRSQTGGTILYVSREAEGEYLSVSVFRDEVTVAWRLDNSSVGRLHRFRKEPDGNWTDIQLIMKEEKIQGGFKGATEPPHNFVSENFPLQSWRSLVNTGRVMLGSGADLRGLADLSRVSPPPGEGEGLTLGPMMDGNDVDIPVTADVTDAPVVSIDGAFFKGCLGEVRIGGLLLSYFTVEQLLSDTNSSVSDADNRTASDANHFALSTPAERAVGCLLCFQRECMNGGSCAAPAEQYSCVCLPGFAADDCSVNVDECASNACMNGAACVDGIANYTCECLPGWEGWLCDLDIDECASSPCENAGTCLDLLGGFECECPEEYMGARCEFERPITCENAPCRLGSTCVDRKSPNKKDNFTCACVPGYEGDYCQTAYCQVDPCRNSGDCDTSGVTPSCQCPAGFTGHLCEENINECLAAADKAAQPPCRHNGRCIDGVNSFTCDCRHTGYVGPTCERDINECKTGEAECGEGVCINADGGYSCVCNVGNCGPKCQFADPCLEGSESPCQHDGTCTPDCVDHASYTCQCNDGWTGANCTDEILSRGNNAIDVAIIVAPIVAALLLIGAISISFFVSMARKKRATRGTYSPSSQEYCNPRVEMDNVMKPPPEERLI